MRWSDIGFGFGLRITPTNIHHEGYMRSFGQCNPCRCTRGLRAEGNKLNRRAFSSLCDRFAKDAFRQSTRFVSVKGAVSVGLEEILKMLLLMMSSRVIYVFSEGLGIVKLKWGMSTLW